MGLAIELVRYQVNSRMDRIDHLIQQDITSLSGEDRESTASKLQTGNDLMGEVRFELSLETGRVF